MRVAHDEKQAHREHVPTEAQFRERVEKLVAQARAKSEAERC